MPDEMKADAFLEWMDKVQAELRRRTGGFGILDFPDYGFTDAFNDEQSPRDVVSTILAQEGWE